MSDLFSCLERSSSGKGKKGKTKKRGKKEGKKEKKKKPKKKIKSKDSDIEDSDTDEEEESDDGSDEKVCVCVHFLFRCTGFPPLRENFENFPVREKQVFQPKAGKTISNQGNFPTVGR